MKNLTFRKLMLAASALLISVAFVGCEEKGPAEKAGDNLDKAGRNIKDAVAPPKTTGEKVGGAIDDATGKK